MAQKEAVREQEKLSLFNLAPQEFTAKGQEYLREFGRAQTELFDKWQEINRHWVDRINTEANLASELASQVTSARSVPEAMATFQAWSSRRFQMMAEDSQHLLNDAQKLMETGAQVLPKGWQPQSSSVGG